ncbi:Intraflagellar_transport protein 140 [Hexamita inflata]|uniref:Intraflagellar_transport protein 140 n=1 Tax=Hexamita inflata TaxID=28002 RepID=A0ABP1KCB1_9EUKA
MIPQINDILLELNDRIVAATSQPCSKITFIAFADNTVRAYLQNDAGSLVRAGSQIAQDIHKCDSKIYSLVCHPFLPAFVVIGASNGSIIVWDAYNGRVARRDDLLSSDVTLVRWLGHGRILCAADAVGRVVVQAFDPLTSEMKAVQKVQRNGKIVAIEERTACTRNFYLNSPRPEGDADRIYPLIGSGPIEILVAWDRGDIVVINDAAKQKNLLVRVRCGHCDLSSWRLGRVRLRIHRMAREEDNPLQPSSNSSITVGLSPWDREKQLTCPPPAPRLKYSISFNSKQLWLNWTSSQPNSKISQARFSSQPGSESSFQ